MMKSSIELHIVRLFEKLIKMHYFSFYSETKWLNKTVFELCGFVFWMSANSTINNMHNDNLVNHSPFFRFLFRIQNTTENAFYKLWSCSSLKLTFEPLKCHKNKLPVWNNTDLDYKRLQHSFSIYTAHFSIWKNWFAVRENSQIYSV